MLEVGAGIGATTAVLCDGTQSRWVCLEPDGELRRRVEEACRTGALPACCEARGGTVTDLPRDELFDTVLYIDVLEHIEDDRREAEQASRHLAPGGHLVLLSPAHPWVFSPFDRALGHHRRYTRAALDRAVPRALDRILLRNLDSLGLLVSLANRLFVRRRMPTAGQLRLWDRTLIPLSRRLDLLLAHRLGRSLLGVFRRPEGDRAEGSPGRPQAGPVGPAPRGGRA